MCYNVLDMTARTPIVYGGKEGVRCYGAPGLSKRLNPPKEIIFSVYKDNTTGEQKTIVVCKRAEVGQGNCGADGPPCIFASFNRGVHEENVFVSEKYRPLQCPTALGDAILHERAHRFTIGGETFPVSPIEESMLKLLMSNVGRPVSLSELWEGGAYLRHTSGKTAEGPIMRNSRVMGNIRNLRQKLGDYGSVIANVRGAGYELRQNYDHEK